MIENFSELIKYEMHSDSPRVLAYTTRNDQVYFIKVDHSGETIEVFQDEDMLECLGDISLNYDTSDDNDNGRFYITSLNLDKCKGLGIGTQCLLAHIEMFGLTLVSAPHDAIKRSDGSHLTGDGVSFIDKMKKLGIVACDCSESLYDGDDGYDMTEEFNKNI